MRNLCQLVLLGLVLLIPSQTAAWAAPEMTADEIFAKSQAVMAAPIQYRMVMGEVESIVSMKDLGGEIGVASRVETVNPVIEQTTITTAKYAYEWQPNTGRSHDLEGIGSAGLGPKGVGGLRRLHAERTFGDRTIGQPAHCTCKDVPALALLRQPRNSRCARRLSLLSRPPRPWPER